MDYRAFVKSVRKEWNDFWRRVRGGSRLDIAILASAAGLFGLAAGCAALIYHLAGLETFGVPYLAPFTSGAGEPRGHPSLLRPPLPRMKWRDGARHTLNRRNQR